jgi:hypothetical protein
LNVKMCLIVLLCLLSMSAACNVAITTLRAPGLSSQSNNNVRDSVKYLTLGGNLTQPNGEDKGGGGWP